MPRGFLGPCQPRIWSVSRGGIFIQDFSNHPKASPLATDFHPGTGINVCRNWDGARATRRGAAFRVSLLQVIYCVRRVFRPNCVVSRGSYAPGASGVILTRIHSFKILAPSFSV